MKRLMLIFCEKFPSLLLFLIAPTKKKKTFQIKDIAVHFTLFPTYFPDLYENHTGNQKMTLDEHFFGNRSRISRKVGSFLDGGKNKKITHHIVKPTRSSLRPESKTPKRHGVSPISHDSNIYADLSFRSESKKTFHTFKRIHSIYRLRLSCRVYA